MTRKTFAVALLTSVVLLSTPAVAAQRDDPRDPITRIVRYLKKVIRVITLDDGMTPPKP